MLLEIKCHGSSLWHLWGETFPCFQKCLGQLITSDPVIFFFLLYFIALENAAVRRARWDFGTRYSETNKSPENPTQARGKESGTTAPGTAAGGAVYGPRGGQRASRGAAAALPRWEEPCLNHGSWVLEGLRALTIRKASTP